jgi:hypothetical protein
VSNCVSNQLISLVEAASRSVARPPTTLAHNRVDAQTVRIVDVFVSDQPAEH